MDKKIEGYFESLFAFVSESGWADVSWVSVSRPPGRPGGVIADITGYSQPHWPHWPHYPAVTSLSSDDHQSRGQGGGKFPIS